MKMRWLALPIGAAAVITVVAGTLASRSHPDLLGSSDPQVSSVEVTRQDIAPTITLRGAVVVTTGRYLARLPLHGSSRSDRIVTKVSTRAGGLQGMVELEAQGLLVRAAVPAELVYRFASPIKAARFQLVGGPGPQPCEALGWVGAGTPPLARAGGVVLCRIRPSVPAVPGQPGVLEVALALRKGVLSLPVEAVAGTLRDGRVRVVQPDGHTREQAVRLGESDGSRIEITGGLHPGDRVALPAPSLPGIEAIGG